MVPRTYPALAHRRLERVGADHRGAPCIRPASGTLRRSGTAERPLQADLPDAAEMLVLSALHEVSTGVDACRGYSRRGCRGLPAPQVRSGGARLPRNPL